MDKQGTEPPDGRRIRGHGLAVGIGILIGIVALPVVANLLGPDTIISVVPSPIVIDPIDDPTISDATFDLFLVQWGTDQNFAGTGAPGFKLSVQTNSDIVGWTVDGYANQTTPSSSPVNLCSSNSIHFDRYDWGYSVSGSSNTRQAAFTTTPTTVPQRASPSGDQCLMRIGATGTWVGRVCIEGANENGDAEPPRGDYQDENGVEHRDLADRCIEKTFSVGG